MHLGTRALTLNLGGFDRTAEVSECRIVAAPTDVTKLGHAYPRYAYRLMATAVQDPAVGTLWDVAWNYTEERVDVEIRPGGGEMPTETNPWFVGTVIVGHFDGTVLGGAADPGVSNRFTFGIDWQFIGKPERVTY